MKKSSLLVLILLPQFLFAQDSTSMAGSKKTHGPVAQFYFAQEFIWNRPDKIMTGYMGRKTFVGFGLSGPRKNIAWYMGIGFKGFKFQFFKPSFTNEFRIDFAAAYDPNRAGGKDSIGGAALYQHAISNGKTNYLFGTYTMHLVTGIRCTAIPLMPTVSYHFYKEDFPFYASSFGSMGDGYDWLALNSVCQELRLGLNLIPVKGIEDMDGLGTTLSLDIGYKWVRFSPMNLDGAYFDRFTNQAFLDRYSFSQRITFGIHYAFWLDFRR